MKLSHTFLSAVLAGVLGAMALAAVIVAAGTPAPQAHTDPLFSYQQPS